jgi:hypothetical protein
MDFLAGHAVQPDFAISHMQSFWQVKVSMNLSRKPLAWMQSRSQSSGFRQHQTSLQTSSMSFLSSRQSCISS